MANLIDPIRVNHMNLVTEDFDASVAHFARLFDAEFVADLPSPAFHAWLFAFGDTLFEGFSPEAWLLAARYGPFHLGIEYQADMDMVRTVLTEQGIRIVRDIGVAVHTHPQDTLGVSFEFYGEHFVGREWPALGGTIKPIDYWTNEHPLGLTGQTGYSIAVEDLDAGLSFLRGFFAAETVFDEARPHVGGHAVGLTVGSSLIEVIAPSGAGEIRDYLDRAGQGIRSTLFGVRDTDAARGYFRDRGVDVVPGSAGDRIMIPAADNRGLLFEFGA